MQGTQTGIKLISERFSGGQTREAVQILKPREKERWVKLNSNLNQIKIKGGFKLNSNVNQNKIKDGLKLNSNLNQS